MPSDFTPAPDRRGREHDHVGAAPAVNAGLEWPGMRSEYSRLAPHEGEVTTRPGQIGVVFTAHRGISFTSDGMTRTVDIRAGASTVTASQPLGWLRVREPTEALEIYPDPGFIESIVLSHGLTGLEPRVSIGATDGVVLAVASRLRTAHLTGVAVSHPRASELAHLLARQLLVTYGGADPRAFRGTGRLTSKVIDDIAQFVDSRLSSPPTLGEMADVARLSPFHFARAFRATTGSTPHAFVTDRRMIHALRAIERRTTVETAAAEVGFHNVGHFRRAFVAAHGVLPSQVRRMTARSGLVISAGALETRPTSMKE